METVRFQVGPSYLEVEFETLEEAERQARAIATAIATFGPRIAFQMVFNASEILKYKGATVVT